MSSKPVALRLKKQPHEQQQKFIEADAPEQLYGGGKRGGKSVALCQKSFLLGFLFPGNRGLLARYNFTDLQDTTLNEFFEVVPGEFIAAHNKGERTIFIRNPHPESGRKSNESKDGYSPWTSRQLYRGLGDAEDFEKTKGINLGHLEIDEPSEVPFEQYLMLRAQLTHQLPDGSRPPYMVLLASNPEPGWVEDRFIVDDTPGCVFIPGLPKDNPFLPPGYEADLRANYPAEWVKKYLDGAWGASEGAVFKELSEELHNLDNWVDPEDISVVRFSMQLELVSGMDVADTGVTCYVQGGVNEAGDLFFFDEYYGQDRLVGDHAIDILVVKHRFENGIAGCKMPRPRTQLISMIDPSAFNQSLQSDHGFSSFGQEYIQRGIVPLTPGWNAMEMSIERIKEHLHPILSHKHPFTGKFGSPSLFISKTRCPMLWKEMRAWKRKRKPPQSSHKAGYMMYTGSDHAIDPVRYVVNARPRRQAMCEADLRGMTEMEKRNARMHMKWAEHFGRSPIGKQHFTGLFR